MTAVAGFEFFKEDRKDLNVWQTPVENPFVENITTNANNNVSNSDVLLLQPVSFSVQVIHIKKSISLILPVVMMLLGVSFLVINGDSSRQFQVHGVCLKKSFTKILRWLSGFPVLS